MLEAKDLPRCSLSDFIEAQLRETIALDTKLRAKNAGIDESMVSLVDTQPACCLTETLCKSSSQALTLLASVLASLAYLNLLCCCHLDPEGTLLAWLHQNTVTF